MTALPYMRMFWADYLADTMNLTTEEHGAYLLLIGTYWRRGKALPDDDKFLATATKSSPKVWRKLKHTLSVFFDIKDGVWTHHRVEKELLRSSERSSSASANAKRRLSGRSATSESDTQNQKNESRPKTETPTSTAEVVPLAKANGRKSASPDLFPKPVKPPSDTPEAQLFRRGRELLGDSAGGVIKNLMALKMGNVHKARAMLEDAAGKNNPKDWIMAAIWNHKLPDGVELPVQVDMGMNY